jgi:hypothetical protein
LPEKDTDLLMSAINLQHVHSFVCELLSRPFGRTGTTEDSAATDDDHPKVTPAQIGKMVDATLLASDRSLVSTA